MTRRLLCALGLVPLLVAGLPPPPAAAQVAVLQLSRHRDNQSQILVRIGQSPEQALQARPVPVTLATDEREVRIFVTLRSTNGRYRDFHNWYFDANRLRLAVEHNRGKPISYEFSAQATEKCTGDTVRNLLRDYRRYRAQVAAWLAAAERPALPPVPEPSLVNLALASAAMAQACQIDPAADSPGHAKTATAITLEIYRMLSGSGYSFRSNGVSQWVPVN